MNLLFNNKQPTMFVYLNNHDYLNNQALFYNLPSPLVNSSWQVVEEYNKQLDKLMPFYDIKLESPIRRSTVKIANPATI